MFTSSPAPLRTYSREISGNIPSKQISTPILPKGAARGVVVLPGEKSPIPCTIFFTNGRSLAMGTYSPNGTRCTLSDLPAEAPSEEMRKALLRSLSLPSSYSSAGLLTTRQEFSSLASRLTLFEYLSSFWKKNGSELSGQTT